MKVKSKKIVQIKDYDGKILSLKVSNYMPISTWKRGRCFSIYCSNPIWVVKLNKNNEAVIGYCPHGEAKVDKNLRSNQKKAYLLNGKLKILKTKAPRRLKKR